MTVVKAALQASTAQLAALKLFADSNGLVISHAGVKIIIASHDVSLTGNQQITGVGFAPKGVVCIATITNVTGATSIGIGASGDNPAYIAAETTAGQFSSGARLIYLHTGAGLEAYENGLSWDSDGITITWAKGGLPTGTVNMKFLFFR